MKQAKIWSYTEGIFPELDDLYALWNVWLMPMYPDLVSSGAFLYYDKESIEVIQELIQAQKDAMADRAKEAYEAGLITMNAANVLAGRAEVPEGNVYRIGNILVPADKLLEYAAQSLAEPAAPPVPQPEPLLLPAPQPQPEPQDDVQSDSRKAIVRSVFSAEDENTPSWQEQRERQPHDLSERRRKRDEYRRFVRRYAG